MDSRHRSVEDHGLPEGKGKMPSPLLSCAEVCGAHALLMGLEVPANNRVYSSCATLPQEEHAVEAKNCLGLTLVIDCTRM